MTDSLKKAEFWLAVLLAILSLAIIILQISTVNETTTKLETTLFNLLQFILSIGFAWLLARISYRREFKESQRQFAIAAYRRIIEIESGVERLLRLIEIRLHSSDGKTHMEFEVAYELAKTIKESIKSSIADWGDVIGDEIDKLEEIERIRNRREDIMINPHYPSKNKITKAIAPLQERLNELESSLPDSLRILSQRDWPGTRYEEHKKKLNREKHEQGYVKVEAMLLDLKREIEDFSAQDILTVWISDFGDRVAALVAHDGRDVPVGVICNSLIDLNSYWDFEAKTYWEFVHSFTGYLGTSKFKVQLLQLESEEKDDEGHYRYFTAKVLDEAVETDLSE